MAIKFCQCKSASWTLYQVIFRLDVGQVFSLVSLNGDRFSHETSLCMRQDCNQAPSESGFVQLFTFMLSILSLPEPNCPLYRHIGDFLSNWVYFCLFLYLISLCYCNSYCWGIYFILFFQNKECPRVDMCKETSFICRAGRRRKW